MLFGGDLRENIRRAFCDYFVRVMAPHPGSRRIETGNFHRRLGRQLSGRPPYGSRHQRQPGDQGEGHGGSFEKPVADYQPQFCDAQIVEDDWRRLSE